jgi:NAD dependent epimerase/dehydratase family enzyme
VLTTGQRAIPAKAQALGYQFQFSEIGGALRSVVGEINHR